jgi:iron-sulfur cluster assembly accessory protein
METQIQTSSGTVTAKESDSVPETPVRLTDKAAAMVKETIERENLAGSGLRVAVVGGGCSGFQYSLDIEKEERAGDLTFDVKGVKCFVDPMSSMYLAGVEVDYVEGQFGQSGFSFKNPNAKHTCGCGSSFSA